MARAQHKTIDRYCSKCGKWCYHVQRVRVFDVQNPDSKIRGWHLQEDIYCTDCMRARDAQHVAVVAAHVRPVARGVPIPRHHPRHDLQLIRKRA